MSDDERPVTRAWLREVLRGFVPADTPVHAVHDWIDACMNSADRLIAETPSVPSFGPEGGSDEEPVGRGGVTETRRPSPNPQTPTVCLCDCCSFDPHPECAHPCKPSEDEKEPNVVIRHKSRESACPKCGSADVSRRWCGGGTLACVGLGRGSYSTHDTDPPKGEHFDRHCRGCSYEWFEPVKESKP